MNKFLKIIIIGTLLLMVCIGIYWINTHHVPLLQQSPDIPNFYLSGTILIADTELEREQGLSGKTSLGNNAGMLFVFPESGLYSFWMKDMLFPLDIIYLDSDMRIVQIFNNVQPTSYPETIVSTQPARYVLEMNAGEAVNKGFAVGSVLHLKNFIPH